MNRRTASSRRHVVSRPIACHAVAALLLSAACGDDSIEGPDGPSVSICHIDGSVGSLRSVLTSALREHLVHGDYVARLEVGPSGGVGDSVHFRRITDALAAARAVRLARNELEQAACRITIAVAPGTVTGTTTESSDPATEKFPLVIDIPDITLRGATTLQLDASGRPTGATDGADVTTLTPVPALAGGGMQVSEQILVINGHPNGSKGHGAIVEGFVLQSGRAATDTTVGGIGILTMRVNDVAIRGNRFENNLISAVDMRASSGLVERLYFSGLGSSCDICLAGPGDFVVRDSRLIGGGIPGVLILPAIILPVPSVIEQYTLPATSAVNVLVENNEVRGHVRKPVGVGLRIGAVGVGAPDVVGSVKARFVGNTLVGNTFGMIVEGAFVRAGTQRRGDIELTTSGNSISQSCQNDLLVTLSQSQVGLGLSNGPYLLNSSFNLTLGPDISWDNAWFANLPGVGNTLNVNGQAIASGSRIAYDAARVCP